MPELPEVETIRRQLERSLVGYRITDIWTDNPKSLQPNPKEFVNAVKDRMIRKVGRRAKLLLFFLDNDGVLALHLKLTGRLLIRRLTDSKDKFVHIVLKIEKQGQTLELRFADARKFGYFRYLRNQVDLEKLLEEYGPEPLNDLTLKGFKEILAKSKKPIKEVLMNQKLVSGIGNIYANDALWLAKVHPKTPAKELKNPKGLLGAIESVLAEGLKTGGASDQWYLNAYGERGHYQEHFKVYGRDGKPCLRCKELIKRIVIGGRGTFYCPRCQES